MLGTQEVFFAVIATTATLAAVFVPLSFLPGQAGGLFREFGFTLAFSVVLSAFVALTLCPMLASRMLTEHSHHHDNFLARFGGRAAGVYRRCLHWALEAPFVVVVIVLAFSAVAFVAYGSIRQELTPREDRAVALMRVRAPQGVSLQYTQSQMKRIEDGVEPMVRDGEIRNIFSISGFRNTSNSGFMVFTLAPWGERSRSQDEIVRDIQAVADKVPSVRAFAIQPNSLGIRGAGNGLQFAVVGNDYDQLSKEAADIMHAMEKDPALRPGAARLRDDAAAALRLDRSREGIRPRHKHHRPRKRAPGDGRPAQGRHGLRQGQVLRRRSRLQHDPDQRSDRSREHLRQDRRRPHGADVVDRDAQGNGDRAGPEPRGSVALRRRDGEPDAGPGARRRLPEGPVDLRRAI